MTMNTAEKKYALERVSGIEGRKCGEIRENYTTPAVDLTVGEILAKYLDGTIIVKERRLKERGAYCNFRQIFNLSQHETEAKRDEPKIKAESLVVSKEATRIKDAIMLGDSKEALELLQAFEGFDG